MATKKAGAKGASAGSGKKLKLTLVRSLIGYTQDQRDTVRALGLRRINYSVTREDSAVLRGMVHKVRHLLKVEED
jgi:large subunit ribosomal protein L30